MTKDDFQEAKAIYLQDKARWNYLAALPEGKYIGEEINEAMRLIESDYEVLSGVLPKEYNQFDKDLHWLTSRFPEGKYEDVPGLCKVVPQAEIAAKDYSLTVGRYVGVAAQADDGFDFEERMSEIKLELVGLDREAAVLAETIQEHLTEPGL